jgi:hypothetical protein
MNQDVSHYSTKERVNYGKRVEGSILNALKYLGYDIISSSMKEDTQDKIDGYIKIKNKLVSLQIKYRSKKNDIISEITCIDDINGIEKSIDDLIKFDGRDYVSCANLYVSLASDCKTLRICFTDDLKREGTKMALILLDKWKKNKNFVSYKNNQGEIKIITDNYSNRRKIIYFAKPNKCFIPSLTEIKLKYPIIVQ